MLYKHKFSLGIGEIIHVNGIPCEYLGMGNFGTNTYLNAPLKVSEDDNKEKERKE